MLYDLEHIIIRDLLFDHTEDFFNKIFEKDVQDKTKLSLLAQAKLNNIKLRNFVIKKAMKDQYVYISFTFPKPQINNDAYWAVATIDEKKNIYYYLYEKAENKKAYLCQWQSKTLHRNYGLLYGNNMEYSKKNFVKFILEIIDPPKRDY